MCRAGMWLGCRGQEVRVQKRSGHGASGWTWAAPCTIGACAALGSGQDRHLWAWLYLSELGAWLPLHLSLGSWWGPWVGCVALEEAKQVNQVASASSTVTWAAPRPQGGQGLPACPTLPQRWQCSPPPEGLLGARMETPPHGPVSLQGEWTHGWCMRYHNVGSAAETGPQTIRGPPSGDACLVRGEQKVLHDFLVPRCSAVLHKRPLASGCHHTLIPAARKRKEAHTSSP